MNAPAGQWRATGTGHVVQTTGVMNRIPAYDTRSNEHLWTWALVYRATPGVETPMLDVETLLAVSGPGCYYCEQIYSPLLAKRRCPGDPRG